MVAPSPSMRLRTNASGIWQIHVWDVASGSRRQVSEHPVGVREGYPTADGSEVIFWQEDTGDEMGAWQVRAYEGGGSEPSSTGASRVERRDRCGSGVVAAGIDTEDGAFGVYASVDGERLRRIAGSKDWMAVAGDEHLGDLAGLSADGSFVAIQHAEHGSLMHPRSGSWRRGAETSPRNAARRHRGGHRRRPWSPVPGDQRLAVTHEPQDRQRAAIWDLATDEWRDLEVDAPGDHHIADWFPRPRPWC
jgi:hypothetical protein